ncbi:MAG: Ig-like domain-containing protein [Oscillospiraceae bacterium]|nr:Ig-like domain-containing protein [Oscillospiraceae bacterium]
MNALKRIKRLISLCLTALLICGLSALCAPRAMALSLNYTNISIVKGYSVTLKVAGTASTPVWTSSDESIATVSSSGKVRGISKGTAVISANVDGNILKCKVNVKNGRLTKSSSSVSVDVGQIAYVTIKARGSHNVKAVSQDKSVAICGWVKKWSGDNVRLKVKGVSEGSTRLKINMTDYTDVYTYITVNVGGGSKDAVLSSAKSSVYTGTGTVTEFLLYCTDDGNITYSVDDKNVATVAVGTFKDHYAVVQVKGLKAGRTTLYITANGNSRTISIPVTVSDTGVYYAATDTLPSPNNTGDVILDYYNPSTRKTMYILVPRAYDSAQVNSAKAADTGVYDYMTIYSDKPVTRASTDAVKSFTTRIVDYAVSTKSSSVVRYILVPAGYDQAEYNTMVAKYTDYYEYYTVYNIDPSMYKHTPTDEVKSWTATVGFKSVTRYMLLPAGYNAASAQAVINADKGTSAQAGTTDPGSVLPTVQTGTSTASASTSYYTVMHTKPAGTISAGDTIMQWTSPSGTVSYMILPANYDILKANNAKLADTGTAEYYTAYSLSPSALTSSDVLTSAYSTTYGTTVYVLSPKNGSKAIVKEVMAQVM